jgi:nicotinamidase-related amidase
MVAGKGGTLCAVDGIVTHFCVLATIMDGICHDFKAVLTEDCAAAFSNEVHAHTLNLYRRNPLYPLMRVVTSLEPGAETTGIE